MTRVISKSKNVEIKRQKSGDFLVIDNKVWMIDDKHNHAEMKALSDQCYGRVLVAGYGLGMVQKHLTENKSVDSFLTIEISSDVIGVCKNTYGEIIGDVTILDFYDFETDETWDCIVGDIWFSKQDVELMKKFTEKAEGLIKTGGEILLWGDNNG